MSPYRQTPDRLRGRMLERIVLRATPHFALIARVEGRPAAVLIAAKQPGEEPDALQRRIADAWNDDPACAAIASATLTANGAINMTAKVDAPISIKAVTVERPTAAARERGRKAFHFLTWIWRGCPGVTH